MNSPRPTISRDLLLQRELLQQEPRTPGLGWGISDRRYLGSFTPALTRAKARECGAANLEVIRGGFLSYKHVGDGVDFAYTRNALHHLPDFWKALALRRIARLLKPGGILRLRDLIFSFQLGDTDRTVEAWLNATAVRPESGWTRSELETHLREEHSTFTWLFEPMLERAGFEIRSIAYDDLQVFAAYTCAKR